MKHKFRGETYTIRFYPYKLLPMRVDRTQPVGLHDNTSDNPKIHIATGQTEKLVLQTIVHESLHACYPEMEEKLVYRGDRDLGSLLWKLGYRLKEKNRVHKR